MKCFIAITQQLLLVGTLLLEDNENQEIFDM